MTQKATTFLFDMPAPTKTTKTPPPEATKTPPAPGFGMELPPHASEFFLPPLDLKNAIEKFDECGEVEIVNTPASKRPTWMRWSKPSRAPKPRSTVLALRSAE